MSGAKAIRPHITILRWRLHNLSSVRVSGTLSTDADLGAGIGQSPGAVLLLQFQPPQGLPYVARMELGTSVADHLHAQAQLPYLRRGALVSVEGDSLELRADHGHAALRVVRARNLLIPCDLLPTPSTDPEDNQHAR